ncbi:MAG: biotin--[acetyl-CoA-carboxylase] ligase [Bacteroidales bacterium]|jgi:BirA family biotin operon repressor/biotin-[acetyl-CoA-carboxylase] ligase|nr:biotin--[acetyl-CoA-carboxylase] ligase [Bacteroidales bacterium]
MKYIYRFSTPKSTNTIANNISSKQPFVLYTYRQRAGKGMGTNSWFTGHGKNIAMSVCFEPKFLSPDRQFLLNIALSTALRNSLQSLLPKQKILLKWPNDIYVSDNSDGNKKLVGILFENKISGGDGEFSKSIMGIGINVNQKKFPDSLPNPVSMRLVSGKQFCKKKIVLQICSELENAFYALANSLSENSCDTVWLEFKKKYLSNLLFYGVMRNYIYKEIPVRGSIFDVDDFGRLLLKKDNGDVICCDVKELKIPYIAEPLPLNEA